MTFSTTSFFAGVGTVFAAVALGFAGGAMITTSPRVEPNRLERVAATAPATTPDAGVKTAAPEVRSVEPAAATRDEMPQSPPAPDRVISQTPAVASQPQVAAQPAPIAAKPVVASDDPDAQAESAKKARADELKRQLASKERRAERRRERRRRDLEAAENAVLQTQPDDGSQPMPQRYDRSPRVGFFGDD